MIALLILGGIAALFAAWYQLRHDNRLISGYARRSFIFLLISGGASISAGVMQIWKSDDDAKRYEALTNEVLLYTRGGDSSMPVIIPTILNDSTAEFNILNPDTVPIFNVQAKFNYVSLGNLGNLYPGTQFPVNQSIIHVAAGDTVLSNFSLWYNNRKDVHVNSGDGNPSYR